MGLPPFPILSPFPLRFLFISSFSLHFLAARLQGCNDSCSPGPTYIRIWSKPLIDFVYIHKHAKRKHKKATIQQCKTKKNLNLLETQKIWTCLKAVLGTERWTCPYSLIFCWRLTIHCQHFFFEIKIWNAEESWYDDYLCAYDSEHDPLQHEGKRSCLFQFVFWK